ncbi:hypothetical protein EMCRGX_G016338 [Ephydatia muelleri]
MNGGSASGAFYPVERVVASRKRKRHTEYLVLWEGYRREESSWVPEADVTATAKRVSTKESTGFKEKYLVSISPLSLHMLLSHLSSVPPHASNPPPHASIPISPLSLHMLLVPISPLSLHMLLIPLHMLLIPCNGTNIKRRILHRLNQSSEITSSKKGCYHGWSSTSHKDVDYTL